MGRKYEESAKKVVVNLNLEANHKKYMDTLENQSKYVRWMFDNDEGYGKFMKEEQKEGQ